MRLCTLDVDRSNRLGIGLDDGYVVDLTQVLERTATVAPPRSVTDVILGHGVDLTELRAAWSELVKGAPRLDLARVRLLPPHLPSANVFCVGVNYRDHAQEAKALVPTFAERPNATWFSKDTRSFCGPFDDVVVDPELTQMLDWEVELGVVIGRGGRHIGRERALEHVFGYTVVNDVSARDVQVARTQWFLGKNLAAASPIGPYVVTADELGDPQDLQLTCAVDGEVKQQASTADMLHSVADLIADLSRFVDLQPGDVISTGTPAGVGAAASPPQFLQAGSRLVTEISRVGRQENVVRHAERA